MKMKSIAIGLVMAITLPLLRAAESQKWSVKSDSATTDDRAITFSGRAVAVLGDYRVSAAQMVLDRGSGTLRCIGDATVVSPNGTMTAINAKIEMKENKPLIRADSIRMDAIKSVDSK
jgi:hypothetical protein